MSSSLVPLSNMELASKQFELLKRYGELSLWIAEADRKIFDMICTDRQIDSMGIKRELELKHSADTERYAVLSEMKRLEIEMENRVNGEA